MPIMSIGLKSWSRFSAITWSGSRISSRNSPPHPTAKVRCWITPCCSTAPTCPTATCTVIIRCRTSWSAAVPARSRGDGRSSCLNALQELVQQGELRDESGVHDEPGADVRQYCEGKLCWAAVCFVGYEHHS